MAAAMKARGYNIVSGGTENHLFLVDLVDKDITGKAADAALGNAFITVNMNAVPNDPRSPFVTSGLRIGTPAVTTRGFGIDECVELAGWICDVMDSIPAGSDAADAAVVDATREKVKALCAKFPVYAA